MSGSLTLGASTTDTIDCGSVAAFNNMTQFSALTFFYVNTMTANKIIMGKRVAGASGGAIGLANGAGPTNISINWARATTNLAYITSAGYVAGSTWYGLAWTADITGSPSLHAYLCTLSTGAITDLVWTTATDGVGAFTDDSANTWQFGNNVGAAQAFPGNLSCAAVYPGVVMTQAAVQNWFQRPRSLAAACRSWRFGDTGISTQPDFSSSATAATPSGCTQGATPPFRTRRIS